MSDRLDQDCRLPVGTRDAIHVPFVVATPEQLSLKERLDGLKPGSYVKFTDENFTKFIVCDKNSAQGVLNPFLDEISYYDNVVVLLMPGITTPVRHNFDIKPELKEFEQRMLAGVLKDAKANDPECAGCYEIRNNRLIRN